MDITKEPKKCKSCNEIVDDITAARCEGLCQKCFTEKVSKIVHPF